MSVKTHGGSKTKLYRVWIGMKRSCYAPKSRQYKNVGSKGIEVFDDWVDNYENFKKWALENGYEDGLVIDRIDTDKDFTPDNTKFVTFRERWNNSVSAHTIKYKGDVDTLSGWAKKLGVSKQALSSRIKKLGNDKEAIQHYISKNGKQS